MVAQEMRGVRNNGGGFVRISSLPSSSTSLAVVVAVVVEEKNWSDNGSRFLTTSVQLKLRNLELLFFKIIFVEPEFLKMTVLLRDFRIFVSSLIEIIPGALKYL